MTRLETATPSPRRPRYLNPFEGPRKPVRLSGLFLFDPEVPYRVAGESFRKEFIAMGEESLFKGMERAGRTGKVTKSLKRRLIAFLPPALREVFATALAAPDAATDAMCRMGLWEAHLTGALRDDNGDPITWPASAHFLCEVERASRHAAALFVEGQSQAGSDYLAGHALLQRFMSPEVLHGMAHATNPNEQLALLTAVAMEVWLSLLALWDIEARPNDTDDHGSYLIQLMSGDEKTSKNTVAHLFGWLLKRANVATPTALMDDPRLSAFSVQIGAVGAWSRGSNFPSASYRDPIAKALLSAEDAATFKVLCGGARQLNFLGYIAQHLEKSVGALEGAKADEAKRLGLGLPFGHHTIEAWMWARYPGWLQFHRASIAARA